MPEQTRSQLPPDAQFLDDHWRKTCLRRAFQQWEPKTMAEAQRLSMECLGRAEAVTELLTLYAEPASESEAGSIAFSVLRGCGELLDDLLPLAYVPMMDWWLDEDDRKHHGWRPPAEEAKR